MIALQEDPEDDAVRLAHANWLAADAANARAWEGARHLWQVIGSARDMAMAPKEARRGRGALEGTRRVSYRRIVRRSVGAALLLAASIAAFLVLRPMADIWLNADHVTAVAETRQIQLDDGSIVFLAPDSALDVAYEAGERRVRLIAGQAFFDVKPDSARPFVVASAHAETRVLGTAFDVQDGASGASVAVERGIVEVSTSQAKPPLTSRLEAGDWVSVSRDGAVERGEMGADHVGAWRTGMLVVQDRPVAEVVETLARYQDARIYIADDLLASQRLTGVYDLNSPGEALDAVVATYGAKIRRIGPWLVVLSSQ